MDALCFFFFLPLLDVSVMIVSVSVLLAPVQVGQTWVFPVWNYLFISCPHVLLFSVALVCGALPAHHSSKLARLAVRTHAVLPGSVAVACLSPPHIQ